MQHMLYGQPYFFTSMETYEVKDFCYFECVNQLLGKNWSIQRRGSWYIVKSDETRIKHYGFKIHISLVSKFAKSALRKIIPILVKHNVAFKFLVDPEVHDFFNSQACNKVSAGKFLTVYPFDLNIFKDVLEDLHKVTKDFFGPYILSDRPFKNSRCLFYRFGSFIGNKHRNVFGEFNATVINEKTGEIDERLPYYQLPEGVSDPFEEIIRYPESSLLKQRYQVIESLSSHSSKGGVYLAQDTKTNTQVVLKEARPYINQNSRNEKDAIVGLIHEEYILKRLQDIEVTPRIIDSFYEWQNYFLVLEYIPFCTLDYTNWQDNNIIINGIKRNFNVFCKKHLTLLKNIICAVEKIHKKGILIGDIAPQNILFHPKTLEVRFIDLEGAYDQSKEKFYARNTSRGFTTYYKDKQKKPNQIEDWCAVSSLSIHLFHPICALFSISQSVKSKYLESLVKDYGLPLEFIVIEERLRQNQISGAKQAIETISTMLRDNKKKNLCNVTHHQPRISELKLRQILGRITDYIEEFVQCPLKGTVFPLDYRALTINRFSVAYGSLGVLYFLYERGSSSTQQLASMIWKDLQNEDLKNFPSGLYVGLSGIAWVLHKIGMKSKGLELMQQVYDSKFIDKSADLFFGAAGWGLASLYFYEETKSQQFLDHALKAAQVVDDKLICQSNKLIYQNVDMHYYSGLMHGNAGLALFFLRLFELSCNQTYLEKAKYIMKSEINNGQIINGDLVWRKNYKEETIYPYFQFGSVGIGVVAIRFYLVLGDLYYLELAKKIANSVANKYYVYPGLFVGMAGIGNFFLDLYAATQHESYLQEAHQIARRIMLYQCSNDQGIAFLGDKLAAICTDYGTGSAGIGLFLHRLSKQGQGNILFLD
ncbi:unnamed protein product [Ectocarpus sp. 12 AP-2014]